MYFALGNFQFLQLRRCWRFLADSMIRLLPMVWSVGLVRNPPLQCKNYLELLKMFSRQKYLFQRPGLAWIFNGCFTPVGSRPLNEPGQFGRAASVKL